MRKQLPALAFSIALTACGGGGSGSDSGLSSDVAQGYAADAATMPVQAASSLDGATSVLEAAVLASASIVPTAGPTAADVTVNCAAGGSVTYTLSGGTAAQQRNGKFDAGETYGASFKSCAAVAGGAMLNGNITLVVTAFSDTAADFTLTVSALVLSSPQGVYTVDGGARSQRSSIALGGGGSVVSSQFTSSGLALASNVNGRQASYNLKSLSWTTNRTQDAGGKLSASTQQGSLDLVSSNPRRPTSTLQISTQGALTLGSDGLAASGAFSVVTGGDKLAVVYGPSSVLVTLDVGNNGSIEFTWTLGRIVFFGIAG